MKGEVNFFLRSSSLNDICLYLNQKKAWIHRRKVLDSLCSRSCIVPFRSEKYTTIQVYSITEQNDNRPNFINFLDQWKRGRKTGLLLSKEKRNKWKWFSPKIWGAHTHTYTMLQKQRRNLWFFSVNTTLPPQLQKFSQFSPKSCLGAPCGWWQKDIVWFYLCALLGNRDSFYLITSF